MLDYKTVYERVLRMKAAMFGEQTSMSAPVPALVNGVRVEQYFLYSALPAPEKSRPFGLMTVSMDNGRLLAYQDCRMQDFVNTEEHGFDRQISYRLPKKLSIEEFKVRQSLMNKLYGEVRKMAFAETLTEAEREILIRYSVLMDQLVPADLIPYYVAMGKSFNEWRNKHV